MIDEKDRKMLKREAKKIVKKLEANKEAFEGLYGCLNLLTKEDLVEIIRGPGCYNVKTRLKKGEMVEALEKEITALFREFLDNMSLNDLVLLTACYTNFVQPLDEYLTNEREALEALEMLGFMYMFNTVDSDPEDEPVLVFPYELFLMFLHYLETVDFEKLEIAEVYNIILAGLAELYGIFNRDQFIKVNDHIKLLKDGLEIQSLYQHPEIIKMINDVVDKALFMGGLGLRSYQSYKGFIVHEDVIVCDVFDKIVNSSGGQTYYMPEIEEIMQYATEVGYTNCEEYNRFFDYLVKKSGLDEELIFELLMEFRYISLVGMDFFGNKFSDGTEFIYESITFVSKKDSEKAFELAKDFYDSLRLWANRGHTPKELLPRDKGKVIPFPAGGRGKKT